MQFIHFTQHYFVIQCYMYKVYATIIRINALGILALLGPSSLPIADVCHQ